MKYPFVFFLTLTCLYAGAQQKIRGVVADSATHQPLSFATIADGKGFSMIAGLGGRFSFDQDSGKALKIFISYIGHQTKIFLLSDLPDTVFLASASKELNVVIIRSDDKKIRRIVNTAVHNKPTHNPDLYNRYECNVYYKMNADLLGFEDAPPDSAQRVKDSLRKAKGNVEEEPEFFTPNKHLLFAETYSKRLYKRPQQLQEVVLASRFSGLKKTYFHNMVTDVLPFHVYTDYIDLNDIDYANPIAKGWQGRYNFTLDNELHIGSDTVFMLGFSPKAGANFNSLRGLVYINSDGYAISHFIGATTDSTKDRQVRFEQVYSKVDGKWFPEELNYGVTIRKIFNPKTTMQWNGHSVIDSVLFDVPPSLAFDNAHPVRLADSIDLHTEADWQRFRKDTLTAKEKYTCVFMDSFFSKYRLEKLVTATSRLNIGRIPFGKMDLEISRLFAQNNDEGLRLGLGVYTNDKVSHFYSIGGWAGYGFKDQTWKGGASVTLYPRGNKDSWLRLGYQNAYRNPGVVHIHEELDKKGLSNWLLGRPDRVEAYNFDASLRKGYWEFRPELVRQVVEPLYISSFRMANKYFRSFTNGEASIGIRYAYGEKRIPVFDYYLPQTTKYPVVYIRLSNGQITAPGYKAGYIKALAALTYRHHSNGWGRDAYRLEGGMINTKNDQPLPASFLLAGNGVYTGGHYYSGDGFVTMRPFDYYTNRYISLLYKHDFDGFFWDVKWSKPFLSLAHNVVYGSLRGSTENANAGIRSFGQGYHESGVLLNQLFRKNLHITDVYLSAGFFYHWNGRLDVNRNSTLLFSLTTGF